MPKATILSQFQLIVDTPKTQLLEYYRHLNLLQHHTRNFLYHPSKRPPHEALRPTSFTLISPSASIYGLHPDIQSQQTHVHCHYLIPPCAYKNLLSTSLTSSETFVTLLITLPNPHNSQTSQLAISILFLRAFVGTPS